MTEPTGSRLVAEDLVLLCWDGRRGRPATRCASALPSGVGGALLLDLVLGGHVDVREGKVRIGGSRPNHVLLAGALDDIDVSRVDIPVDKAVERLASRKRIDAVTGSLVDNGVMRRDERRLLGLFPIVRHLPVEERAIDDVRARTRALLVGETDPVDAEPRDLLVAALSRPVEALSLMTSLAERKEAERRAQAFERDTEIAKTVGKAFDEIQTAVAGAVVAITATSGVTGGSN